MFNEPIQVYYVYVWHKPYFEEGMLPHKLFLEKGTIVIDSTLTEDTNQGRENFTVMHEVFHQVLHKNCFCKEAATYAHETTKSAIQGGKRKLKTSLDFIEYQANTCAAAFLMPESLTKRVFNKKMLESPLSRTNKLLSEILIAEMADEFSVSNKAMKYRLQNLKLI